MQDLFDALYSNGALLILWGALLFHWILPIPQTSHPAMLWRAFARLLAEKVNRNQSYSQSLISGSLAWLLMTVPALVVLVALQPLVWQNQLFQLALLLLAVDWRGSDKLSRELATALNKQDKQKGRNLLAPLLNRETGTLSPLGLGKAGAETILLGYGRNVIAVLFWFALTGGIGAFLYRLTQELARAWSPSRREFLPFGLPAVRVLALLDYIPLRLFSLLLIPGKGAGRTLSQTVTQGATWPLPGPGWLLSAAGNKLELSLGGPAIYGDKKSVRPKLGGRIGPAALHLAQLQKLLMRRTLVWLLIQSSLMLLIYQGI